MSADTAFFNYAFLTSLGFVELCICAIGYIGNIIICVTIASNKMMHTTTNVYLFNLAIADFIMLTMGILEFVVPAWRLSHGIYNQFGGCVIRKSLFYLSFSVSIMTIMVFTIERYLAICRPFLARRISSITTSIKLIIVIWIIGSAFGCLRGAQFALEGKVNASCKTDNADLYDILNIIQSIVFFILPFTLLTTLYILIGKTLVESGKIQKNQGVNNNATNNSADVDRKTFNMLVIIVAVFFICWAPYHCANFISMFTSRNFIRWVELDEPFDLNLFLDVAEFTHDIYSIAYCVSASINPIIYSAMSNKFRQAFKESISKLLVRLRN